MVEDVMYEIELPQVVPSLQYPGDTALERGTSFIQDPTGGAIPYFEDFNVEVCSKTDADCMKRCFDLSSGSRTHLVSISSQIIVSVVAMLFMLYI